MSDFYNRDGSKLEGGVLAWARKFETEDRRVALDKLPDGKIVSTVFLGLDHSFTKQGSPLIFETMVFSKKEKGNVAQTLTSELDCERYATEEEALKGHKKLVKFHLSKIK